MPCDRELLRNVPLFALLDDDEAAVLASQVEMKQFAARQRIYKIGDEGGRGYILVSGKVRVATVDQDDQEVTIDEPAQGEFFGFASMLDGLHHMSHATAIEPSVCIEVDRKDIAVLLERKPHSGMDMLTVLGRQFHSSQELVRLRAARNPNELIEEKTTFGESVADSVAKFGGSWNFIITCFVLLVAYTIANVLLGHRAWDPYPFILLNLFLSMLAAIQAPIIMMSQNRQDSKDRVRSDLDFEVNRRSEFQIQGLARKLNLVSDKIDDVQDLLRGKTSLTE